MSQEYKLVPVIATEEMINKVFCGTARDMSAAQAQWASAVMAAPVPPAGGDVEVQRYKTNIHVGHDTFRWDVVRATDFDAHVTRLQADILAVTEHRDELKHQRDVWFKKHGEVQSELTKARELLAERSVIWNSIHGIYQSVPAANGESQ